MTKTLNSHDKSAPREVMYVLETCENKTLFFMEDEGELR